MTKSVDDFINLLSAQENAVFALPIIAHVRSIILSVSPTIEEAIKWGQPCFSEQGLLCSIAAFKSHVNFSFFYGHLIKDHANLFIATDNECMRTIKFKSFDDLPRDEIIIDYINQAIVNNSQINCAYSKTLSTPKDKSSLIIPDDFQAQLSALPAANSHFSRFSYSKQKDYIEWITSAKREQTRAKRLATAIEWISEGKSKNWKYENC